MGGSSTKPIAVTPEPISTTVTVVTTICASTADLASEVKCCVDNSSHEILHLSLAFISGILSTVLVFAIICLVRKKYKRSRQDLQEHVPCRTVTEEPDKNIQDEVAYTTLVFQQSRTLTAV